MNRIEFLKQALKAGCGAKLSWIFSAFTLTAQQSDNEAYNNPYPYAIVRKADGVYYTDEETKLILIEGSKADQPLFTFKEVVSVDSSWAPNIPGNIETSIGNLIFNAAAVLPSFGKKFTFLTGKINPGKLQDIVAPRLQSTPKEGQSRSDEFFYVDEYIKFTNGLNFLEELASICAWSATPKGIVAPVGVREFKKKLELEYGDRLRDPVVLAEFEAKLKQFDDDFLKDDPAYNSFISGKVKNIARKKLFLTVGAPDSVKPEMEKTVITESLDEGWSKDPKKFVASMNDIRFGSYSRGTETINGGVSAKYLLRAANNFKIVKNDCGSTLGISRVHEAKEIHKLVDRYILINNKTVLVENIEQAKQYIGRPVIIRSAMYCKKVGDTLCGVCSGKKLQSYPEGLTIPLTEVSSIILLSSLKAMHGKVLETAELDLELAFS